MGRALCSGCTRGWHGHAVAVSRGDPTCHALIAVSQSTPLPDESTQTTTIPRRPQAPTWTRKTSSRQPLSAAMTASPTTTTRSSRPTEPWARTPCLGGGLIRVWAQLPCAVWNNALVRTSGQSVAAAPLACLSDVLGTRPLGLRSNRPALSLHMQAAVAAQLQ